MPPAKIKKVGTSYKTVPTTASTSTAAVESAKKTSPTKKSAFNVST